MILKLPRCWTIAWAEILQDLQAKHDDTEVDLSSQGMALGLREGHDRTTDQATEQLLILQIAKANRVKVALEELENTHVGRQSVLRILLLSEHQGFVCWEQLDLCVHWINTSEAVSISVVSLLARKRITYSKEGSNSPCRH